MSRILIVEDEESIAELEKQANTLDVEILSVPLHKIFVYLTGGTKEENIA